MRLLLSVAIFLTATCSLVAVGTVMLENTPMAVGDDGGRFFDDRGNPLSGPDYLAQLYAGTTSNRLVAVGSPVVFLTNALSGYFRGGQVDIPFVADNAKTWVQVRAWTAAGGASFEAAALSGHWTGISSVLYVTTGGFSGGVPVIPARLEGLRYPGSPILVKEPEGAKIRAGGLAVLLVVASGGTALQYQWHLGASGNVDQPIENATNANYVASPDMTSQYWVRVYTSAGSTNSATATVTVIPTNAVALDLRVDGRVPVLTVETPATGQLQVQFSGTVGSPNWDTLTNISLTTNRLTIVDAGGSNALIRFYRGFILP